MNIKDVIKTTPTKFWAQANKTQFLPGLDKLIV